jgi:hypothetical protein
MGAEERSWEAVWEDSLVVSRMGSTWRRVEQPLTCQGRHDGCRIKAMRAGSRRRQARTAVGT